jgi:hypothetical protein
MSVICGSATVAVMRTSNVVAVSALLVVAVGLLILEATTGSDWSWWAIGFALAAGLVQVLRPRSSACPPTGGRR